MRNKKRNLPDGPPKRRRRRFIMNSAVEINKRVREVNRLSLFGSSALTFPDKISTTRGGMATKHTSQRVVLTNPEFPRLFTGAENAFGDRSSWNIKAEGDYQLMKVFRKFKDNPCSPVAYIFKNLNNGKYKCEIVRPAEHLTENFGFRMHNNMGGYVEGDVLPKGTIIAQSSSYVDDNYCGGRNARMAYTVLPELTEDSIVISEELAKELEYDSVYKITVKVSKNAFLLNRYGTDDFYKPFPDVGEMTTDGILCSVREDSYLSSLAETRVSHSNDINSFVNGDGMVVDIDIFSNIDVENEQVNRYLAQIREWYSEIYAYIAPIIDDVYQDDTTLLDIYHKADKFLNDTTWVTKQDMVDTLLEFTVVHHTEIRPGQKITGRMGNKSVISKIIPRRLMPMTFDYDDEGKPIPGSERPIDMLANGLAVLNRIISFATYELSMTFQMERIHQHIQKLNDDNVSHDEIISLVSDFVSIYNPEQASEIMRLYHDEPEEVFEDVIENGLYQQIEPLNDVCIRDALMLAEDKYPDILKRYGIKTKLRHRWVELDGRYTVGYQYIWVLKQEPTKALSAIATGRTTWYDLPVKTRQFKHHLRRYSDNPVKFGEYDTYNFLSGVGVKEFAKMSTYYRGSQYTENSILMSHLEDRPLDLTKYNQFPQLDNLSNVLKLMGEELKPDIFNYSTIGNIDEEFEVMINNVKVNISIPDLRYVLIMHSYYLQYAEYLNVQIVDMADFLNNISETNLFDGCPKDYIEMIYNKFAALLPVLQQLKQYK